MSPGLWTLSSGQRRPEHAGLVGERPGLLGCPLGFGSDTVARVAGRSLPVASCGGDAPYPAEPGASWSSRSSDRRWKRPHRDSWRRAQPGRPAVPVPASCPGAGWPGSTTVGRRRHFPCGTSRLSQGSAFPPWPRSESPRRTPPSTGDTCSVEGGTLPGYGFREFAGTAVTFARLEGTKSVRDPWLRLGVFGAVGASWLESGAAPPEWRTSHTGLARYSAGLTLNALWDVLQFELGPRTEWRRLGAPTVRLQAILALALGDPATIQASSTATSPQTATAPASRWLSSTSSRTLISAVGIRTPSRS